MQKLSGLSDSSFCPGTELRAPASNDAWANQFQDSILPCSFPEMALISLNRRGGEGEKKKWVCNWRINNLTHEITQLIQYQALQILLPLLIYKLYCILMKNQDNKLV